MTAAGFDEEIMMNRLADNENNSFSDDSFDKDLCDEDGALEAYEKIHGHLTIEEKCHFYTEVCPTDRLIDYAYFRFCYLGENTVAVVFGIALLILWLLVLFYMLSQAAESHFCPMLSEISSALRMSPDLAGMSILAFGNGFVFLLFF